MSTLMATMSAFPSAGWGPKIAHTANETRAIASTAETNHPETSSASFWIGARERPASETN